MLKGEKIYLRQIEMDDIQYLLLWENDSENWRYSETEAPYSRYQLEEYVKTASLIRENQQLRLIICLKESDKPIDAIDLFLVDFKHSRTGVGILIYGSENRQKGYAFEAVELMVDYAKTELDLKQIFCEIQETNTPSIQLFEKAGFERTGIKKDWFTFKGTTIDCYFYQKILK